MAVRGNPRDLARSTAAEGTMPPLESASSTLHLRWDSAVIGAAIHDAFERSRTFREMVTAINASDSYVMISVGHCGHGVRACFVSVRSAGPNRYMFVRVDPGKHDCELMASIGHELRHTLEVIAEPGGAVGRRRSSSFTTAGASTWPAGAQETLTARDAGNAVRSEIEHFNRQSHLQ
jgi:hypothetical protein